MSGTGIYADKVTNFKLDMAHISSVVDDRTDKIAQIEALKKRKSELAERHLHAREALLIAQYSSDTTVETFLEAVLAEKLLERDVLMKKVEIDKLQAALDAELKDASSMTGALKAQVVFFKEQLLSQVEASNTLD